jgi:hypothetical protein
MAVGQKQYSKRGTEIVTAHSMLVHIPSTATFNLEGAVIADGDGIGFFYDSAGTECIAGVGQWFAGFSTDVAVYGDDLTVDEDLGFLENEIMAIKVFDVSEQCVFENYDYVLQSGTVTWRENANDTLLSVNLSRTFFGYSSNKLCIHRSDTLTPVFAGEARHVWYSSNSPDSCKVDSATGAIIGINCLPGSYEVYAHSGSCLSDSVFNLTVADTEAELYYLDSIVCSSQQGTVSPLNNGALFPVYTPVSGLSIDEFTGDINLDLSQEGEYRILVSTSSCLASDSLYFEIKANDFSVQYDSLICPGRSQYAFPLLSDKAPADLWYSHEDNNLSLDSAKGRIDLSLSSPRSYLIKFNTSECLVSDSQRVIIESSIGSISYPIDSFCSSYVDTLSPEYSGSVQSSLVYFEANELQFDTLSGEIPIKENTPGTYNISFNTTECIDAYSQSIQIIDTIGEIFYPTDSICIQNVFIDPVISYPGEYVFLGSSGIEVDSISGRIDLTSSLSGNHSIQVVTESCLTDTSLQIHIDSVSLEVLYTDTSLCSSRTPTYSPSFIGIFDSVVFAPSKSSLIIDSKSGVIDVFNSTEGLYQIEISSEACMATNSVEIIIERDSLVIGYGGAICQTEQNEVNLNTKKPLPPNTTFSTQKSGLALDTANGSVNAENSDPGIYEIEINTTACIVDSVISIEIKGPEGTISYSDSEICQTETEATAQISGGVTFATYKSQTGLELDTITGTISPELSDPGEYYVRLFSTSCLSDTAFQLTIHDSLNYLRSDFDLTPVSCDNKGEIQFIGAVNGDNPTFKLVEESGDTSIADSPEFNELEDGSYLLEIRDQNGCFRKLQFQIVKDCENLEWIENGDAVLTPNLDGPYKTIDIPCDTYPIKIYDRRSQLVKTLVTDSVWDGTDNNGEVLPTGLYIIFCGENERLGEVSIVD